jgi:hypothetical protein
MKIGQATAIFLTVIFFFIVASIIAVSVENIFKNFSFVENPLIRIIFLLINFFIAQKYYNYIYKNVEDKEGKHEVAVYSKESDIGRKIAVISVIIIIIVIVGLVIFMNL